MRDVHESLPTFSNRPKLSDDASAYEESERFGMIRAKNGSPEEGYCFRLVNCALAFLQKKALAE
jgi:hypothetical protein